MQTKFEEEENCIKELKRKNDTAQEQEMFKTKNSLQLKKKNIKKSKQNRANFAEQIQLLLKRFLFSMILC